MFLFHLGLPEVGLVHTAQAGQEAETPERWWAWQASQLPALTAWRPWHARSLALARAGCGQLHAVLRCSALLSSSDGQLIDAVRTDHAVCHAGASKTWALPLCLTSLAVGCGLVLHMFPTLPRRGRAVLLATAAASLAAATWTGVAAWRWRRHLRGITRAVEETVRAIELAVGSINSGLRFVQEAELLSRGYASGPGPLPPISRLEQFSLSSRKCTHLRFTLYKVG